MTRRRPIERLSKIEKEVTAEIRAMRAAIDDAHFAFLLENPAELVHHFILASRGNVQLRMRVIARELGIGMRTLERTFTSTYDQTMAQYHAEVRLFFSKWMLSVYPPTKISVVGALLGYSQVQNFNRFFAKRMKQSPSEWSRKEREGATPRSGRSPPGR